MKPSQVAAKLRQIASAIDNSNNPRKDLVAADLKRVISRISAMTLQFEVADGSPLALDHNGLIGIPFTNTLEALPVVNSVEWGRHSLTIHLNDPAPLITKVGPAGRKYDEVPKEHYPAGMVHTLMKEMEDGQHGEEMEQAVDSLMDGVLHGFGPKPLPFELDDLSPDDDNYF